MDDVTWCYAVGTTAAVVVFTVITIATNRKTAADATGLSQTGGEGTTGTTTEVQQPPPQQQEAPKSDAKASSKEGTKEGNKEGAAPSAADLAAIAAAFDYSKNPLDMPDELVMPEFGTVRQQAAFALGGAAKQHRKEPFSFSDLCSAAAENPEKIPGNIPLAVFSGMCEPIEQNATELIIRSTFSGKGRSDKALAAFAKILPADDWQQRVKKAQQFVAYCGAAPDAQKLHDCFGPDGADYSEELSKLIHEQAEFEAAVAENLEELRKWLAEHTDKDEFKQPPVYLENTGANKVDDVIPDQSNAAKPLGPSCDGESASASKTEQAGGGPPSGASGSSGSKSSSDEAAPAAATPTTPDAAAAAPTAAPPVLDAAAPAAAAAAPAKL